MDTITAAVDATEYLKTILAEQQLDDDSEEMEALREARDAVETLLKEDFSDASPTIRYGGSKVKGTLIRELYDLDIVFYVPSGNDSAGKTLEEIYNNTADALSADYYVLKKNSALRLQGKKDRIDFHIDVVPGRYTDDTKTDCYLHQNSGDKQRLKTNLDTHIAHIRDSGVRDALRLLKLLRVRKMLGVKQFAYELLAVELLKDRKKASLQTQIEHVLREISDANEAIAIEDPANPSGNDLMPLLKSSWFELQSMAKSVLATVEYSGWEAVFGPVQKSDQAGRATRLAAAVGAVQTPTKSWSA